MKKNLFTLFLLATISFSSFAQLDIQKKEPCWYKGARRDTVRYVESECGVLVGVIDCNEKLEYDENNDVLYSKGSGELFSGDCETCHNNGIREHLMHFVSGKQDGIDTTYYRTGCPMVVQENVIGVQNGKWTYFYDSVVRPAWIMNYQNGQLNGEQIYFGKKGDTTKWEFYKQGVMDGVKRTYYPGSKIEEEVHYKNGIIDGDFLTYFPDGKPSKKLHFKNGQKDGKLEYYYNNGALLTVENYTLGVKNGDFKTFFIEGNLQSSESYIKGKREGWFIEKYPNGRTKSEYLYAKDIQIEYRKYNEYGRLTEGTPQEEANVEDDKLPSKKGANTSKTKKTPKTKKVKAPKADKTKTTDKK